MEGSRLRTRVGTGRVSSVVLLLELGEQVVEPVEPVVPAGLEGSYPMADGLERGAVCPVEAPAAGGPAPYEVHAAQDAEVLRHLRLRETKAIDEITDRDLAFGQGQQDLSTARLRDGVERVGRCCGPG